MITLLLGKIAVFALIVAVGYAIGAWSASLGEAALRRTRLDPIAQQLVAASIRPAVLAVAAYAALHTLHVDISPLLAVFAAAGLAIALALKDSLSAVAAGALLLTIRPYDSGDTIEVAGITGAVIDYDLFTVTLKAPDGALVTLPNELLLKSPVHNLTRNGLRRVQLQLHVDHGAPLDRALADVLVALNAHESVVAEPAPTCLITELTLDGAALTATAWVRPADLAKTRSALLLQLDQLLAAGGIARARRATGTDRA